jgi:hypothetical protein
MLKGLLQKRMLQVPDRRRSSRWPLVLAPSTSRFGTVMPSDHDFVVPEAGLEECHGN